MPMLAEQFDIVIGGDTHAATHTLHAVAAATGAVLGQLQVNNDAAGSAQALIWINDLADGAASTRVGVGLEGTRSYGTGLSRVLQAAGLAVFEVERPRRADRRQHGKSDPIDAALAARALMSTPAAKASHPRADGAREALRILLVARAELNTTRTAHTNRLKALLLTGTDTDRADRQAAFTTTHLTTLAARTAPQDAPIDEQVRAAETRRLATAILTATTELAANQKQLHTIADTIAPLTSRYGIGPVSAAQAIVSFSHPGRCRNEAAFAALAGTSPLPASSGRITRHRLNRGGDRQLNRAAHAIMRTRWASCPRTRAYIERRRAQGTPDRNIQRSIKRYITRELFRILNNQPLDNP